MPWRPDLHVRRHRFVPVVVAAFSLVVINRCTISFVSPLARRRPQTPTTSAALSRRSDGQSYVPDSLQFVQNVEDEVDELSEPSGQHPLVASRRDAIGLLGAILAGNGLQPAYADNSGPWTYEMQGVDWGNLNNKYAGCNGDSQAPIDLNDKSVTSRGTESLFRLLSYKPADTEVINTFSRTVQCSGDFGTFSLPDGQYKVKQFHFHFPSEHELDGKLAAGELHIVHQKEGSSGTDDLAVVGIFLKMSDSSDGPEGQFFRKLGFGTGLPSEGGTMNASKVNLNAFVSQYGGSYYHYRGSLTTPPCSETVHWYVLKRGAPITTAMVDSFKARFPRNNRIINSLNGRKLVSGELMLKNEY